MTKELFPGLELSDRKVRAVLVGCGEQATNLMHDAIAYMDAIDVVGVWLGQILSEFGTDAG